MESVTVVTEPLLHRDFVQFEIVVPILEQLSAKYDVTLAAPRIAPEVQEELERRNIRAADGGARFPTIRWRRDEIPSFIGSWARDSLFGWNRRDIERALEGVDGIRVNVSMTTAIDADVWLIQSRPLGVGLDAMRRGVNPALRVALAGATPIVGRLDLRHLLDAGRRARERYSTTQHVADWFASKGLPVNGVTPMYYRPTIHPTTRNPSRDFILVYVGKETDSTALRMLLETGLPVTMFGSKSFGWVKKALRLHQYPHARLLGHISDEELSDLYSNARFTAFPFTEEPFGLVPLESMACGTPVLTYGEQGPGESVLDGRTGWLTRSPQEFVGRALEIWNAGTPSPVIVDRCLARAQAYHLNAVRAGWDRIIETAIERSEQELPTLRATPRARPTPSPVRGPVSSVRSFEIPSGVYRPVARSELDLHPILPTFPTTPSPLDRSGAYFQAPEIERGPIEANDDVDGDPFSRPTGATTRSRLPSRHASTEGAPASTL
jgi:glycosyltransferase involved in cell wall biosynthesis